MGFPILEIVGSLVAIVLVSVVLMKWRGSDEQRSLYFINEDHRRKELQQNRDMEQYMKWWRIERVVRNFRWQLHNEEQKRRTQCHT